MAFVSSELKLSDLSVQTTPTGWLPALVLPLPQGPSTFLPDGTCPGGPSSTPQTQDLKPTGHAGRRDWGCEQIQGGDGGKDTASAPLPSPASSCRQGPAYREGENDLG